jgi:hypothetical protein
VRRGGLLATTLAAGLLAALLGAAPARAQVPDLTSMSGIPLPMTDVPAGTASVRVVRFDMAHPVVALEVTLHPTGAGQVRRLKTDSTGRASFDNLGNDEYVARTTVDGKELRSQPFRAGAGSGIRMLLVAPAATGAGAPAGPGPGPASIPAVGELPPGHPPIDGQGAGQGAGRGDEGHEGHDHGPGVDHAPPASLPSGPMTTDPGRLSLASGSEIIVDFIEDAVRVTQVFLLRNDGPTFDPGPRGLVFLLPDGVSEVSVPKRGPRLQVEEKRAVIMPGPIGPGESRVAVQYVASYKHGLALVIPVPVRSEGLLVGHRPTGLTVEVPGYQQRDEVDSPSGGRFTVYRMKSLPAGSTVTVTLSHSRRVEWLAGLFVLGLLGWLAFGAGGGVSPKGERAQLEARREQLLTELCAIERQQRPGKELARKLQQKRDDLIARLEQVYRDLDERGAELY